MTKGVKLGSVLDNWRASEARFSAIEQRIAKVVDRQATHSAEPNSLVKLFRARENARQSADKWWALLVQDVNGIRRCGGSLAKVRFAMPTRRHSTTPSPKECRRAQVQNTITEMIANNRF